MTKPKTLEQLRAEKERAEIRFAQEQHKLDVWKTERSIWNRAYRPQFRQK